MIESDSSGSTNDVLTPTYPAIAAIVDMANAADFDRKMLLLATQLAHESDSKAVLLSALEALLRTVHSHGPMDSDSEAILLVRCILRLVIRLRKECQLEVERYAPFSLILAPLCSVGSNSLSLSLALIKHFKTGIHFLLWNYYCMGLKRF